MCKIKWHYLLSLVLIVGLFFFFHRLSPFIYLTNDDLFFKTIVSGEVTGTPTSRLWYIGFPAGLLVSSLYRLFPALPWYGLFLCASFGVTLWVVLGKIFISCKHLYSTIICAVLFLIGSYAFLFLHVAEIQFTTVTAMTGAGALFVFVLTDVSEKTKTTLLSFLPFFLLCFWSVSIRDKAFLMLFPLLGLFFLGKYLDLGEGKLFVLNKKRKNLLSVFAILLLLFIGVKGIHAFAYSSPDWRSFGRYTDDSETIYDYNGYPDYDSYKDIYEFLGISRTSYEAAAHHYNILLECRINEKTMNILAEISEAQRKSEFSNLPEKVKNMAVFFLDRHISYTDRPLNLLVYCLYPLFFILALIGRKKQAVRDLLFTGIGRMVIWIYLVYYGRLPSRVSQGVYLAELAILLALAIRYRLWENRAKYLWYATLCFLLFLMFRFGFPKAEAAKQEARSRNLFSESFVELKEYFSDHSDSFYYLDMNSFGSFTEDALKGGKNSYGNYLLMGSWVPHSPWYDVKLKRENIEDPALALIKRDDVFAVFMKTEQTGWGYLADFYAEKYPGSTLHVVEEVETRNGIVFQILSFSD